jgi:hypothetical protein
MNQTRRVFLMTVAASGALISQVASAQTKLDEKDPKAVGLGYVADATKTDTKKYPRYAAGQKCSATAGAAPGPRRPEVVQGEARGHDGRARASRRS